MMRSHAMPFGAEVMATGVRFRLWAPNARRVELCIGDRPDAPERMHALLDGWFELVSRNARAGSRYRFRLENGLEVPDPASRYNPDDVHGPSLVVDPRSFRWEDDQWSGRPWEEAVIYELHVGAFTPEGTFGAAMLKLDHLAMLGVSAISLMPVADFPGRANWGYDGVLAFAPDSRYGSPDDLKRLVQAAHGKGLSVFLDVVYNHFGPEGNYLYVYAKPFFDAARVTPWGSAINFDGTASRPVREFFIHNALFWLEEYHFDGLRLDAVHTIADRSVPDILVELADRVRDGAGRTRPIHLILENDDNAARYLERNMNGSPRWYTAQWNDDVHHALHCLLTSETERYYEDYADAPATHLGRALAEGFSYQGEASAYRGGRKRGEPSRHLPPTAFIGFLQNHDQIGNRAFGERLSALIDPRPLRAALTLSLLAPSPPLLFMGEEFACTRPFLFFCDFGPELAAAVTAGRRSEFRSVARFSDPAARRLIPDPCDPATFAASKLDWTALCQPESAAWLTFYRRLLELRWTFIVPRVSELVPGRAHYQMLGDAGLMVVWKLGARERLALCSHLGTKDLTGVRRPRGELFAASDDDVAGALARGILPAWSTAWFLSDGGRGGGP